MATFRGSSSTYNTFWTSYSAAKPLGTVSGDFQLAFVQALFFELIKSNANS